MMTLSKLARLANVSVSTASKAFSMSNEVNAETREMIFAVAKEHGCFKKFFNAKYPKPVIAIICPEFSGGHYPDYLCALHKYLSEENCEVCVATTNFSAERTNELIAYYDKYSDVDGIICIGGKCSATNDCQVPIVNIDSGASADIMSDLRPAMMAVAAHLLKNGITSVGFIGEPLTQGKRRLFCEIMEQSGIGANECLIVSSSKRFYEGGYEAMEQLLASGEPPRAVVCAYDCMAMGAMQSIARHGLRIPEDIAVLGMDNIAGTPYLNPPLASISCNEDKVCRLACQMLLDKINDVATAAPIAVEARLCLRDSFQF